MSKQISIAMYRNAYNNDASDVLLKKICELQNTLQTAKLNAVKNEKAISFYESVLHAMKYAWGQMTEQTQVYKHNQFLKTENDFLKEQLRTLQEELNKYKTVEQLIATDELKETVNAVTQYLNKNPNE